MIRFYLRDEEAESIGWTLSNGLTLYTTNIGERDVLNPNHGTFLDAQASLVVSVQNIKRVYLGNAVAINILKYCWNCEEYSRLP